VALGLEKHSLNDQSISDVSSLESSRPVVGASIPDETTPKKDSLQLDSPPVVQQETPSANSPSLPREEHSTLIDSRHESLAANQPSPNTLAPGGELAVPEVASVHVANSNEHKLPSLADAMSVENDLSKLVNEVPSHDEEAASHNKSKSDWLTRLGTLVALTGLAFLFWRQCILGALRLWESRSLSKLQGGAQDGYAVMPSVTGKPYLSV